MDGVVAHLEGKDPVSAIRRTLAAAKVWKKMFVRMLDDDGNFIELES